MLEQNVIVLKAKPVNLHNSEEYHSANEQDFVFWDESDWKQWPHGKDFAQIIRDGVAAEIQVQPLRLSDENRNVIEEMVEDGALGTSIYRHFWFKRDLAWEEDKERRICWKLDSSNDIVYATFDKGKWEGEDGDFHFNSEGKTNDFSGTCLSQLKFATTDVPRWLGGTTLPTELDYSACAYCEFDGIRKLTSFRGAHLHRATFCGKSTLFECDLSSSICWGVTFSFPDKEARNVDGPRGLFRTASLKGAWVENHTFDFKVAESEMPESERLALYGLEGCCGNVESPHCKLGFGIDFYIGLRRFVYFLFFAIWKTREILLKHKHELSYLVNELERLRSYEVSKDNWQEIIDSWLALQDLPLETKMAANVRYYLFRDDSTRASSNEIMVTGRVLYSIDDDPPHGLLLQIKRLVGDKLLRNKDYMTRIKWLTDEISNIDAILVMKDQIMTLLQNFVLGLFVLGANIVSDVWGYDIAVFFGGDAGGDNNSIIDL